MFGGRRRVPGLRREELAQLAGISADYYTRLEQGRLRNVSEQILNAVADALNLDETERAHLHNLAKPTRQPPRVNPPQRIRSSHQWLLDALQATPAYILDQRMDIIAWNPMASALLTVDLDAIAPAERNMARLLFLDPTARDLWTPWQDKARDTVGSLRMCAGKHPEDQHLASLVGELSVTSPEFRQWWADHQVWSKTHGIKHLHHPIVGDLTVTFDALPLPDTLGHVLITYTAQPGSADDTALRLLSSWSTHHTPASGSPSADNPER